MGIVRQIAVYTIWILLALAQSVLGSERQLSYGERPDKVREIDWNVKYPLGAVPRWQMRIECKQEENFQQCQCELDGYLVCNLYTLGISIGVAFIGFIIIVCSASFYLQHRISKEEKAKNPDVPEVVKINKHIEARYKRAKTIQSSNFV